MKTSPPIWTAQFRQMRLVLLLFTAWAATSLTHAREEETPQMPALGSLSAVLKYEGRSPYGELRFRVVVTNHSKKPIRLCFIDSWWPEIIGGSGERYQLKASRDATRAAIPEDVPLVKPGRSASVAIHGHIMKSPKEEATVDTPEGRSLSISDRVGGTHWADNLKDDTFWLCLIPMKSTSLRFFGLEKMRVSISSLKLFPPTNWVFFKADRIGSKRL